MRRLAAALMEGERARGYTVAVWTPKYPWVQGFGAAAPGRPAEGQTRYEAGSITKTVTALLWSDAIERGELSEDATVGDVLQDAVDLPADKASIPLAALANHTSGLPRMPVRFAPADPADPYADFTESMLWEALREAPMGPSAFAYSNLGMAVLGQLVAHQAGQPYEELVRQRLFEPLGLEAFDLTGDPGGLAQGHREGTSGPPWTFQAFAPAGALRASAPELLAYAVAHFEPAEHAMGRAMRRVLSPSTSLPDGSAVGYGWMISGSGVRWHNGETFGHHAFLALDPSRDVAVAVMASTAAPEVDLLGHALVDALTTGNPKLDLPPPADVAPDP